MYVHGATTDNFVLGDGSKMFIPEEDFIIDPDEFAVKMITKAGNVLWVDHVFGDDGTALVDRQDKPWSSIATAIGNASTNDTIMVRPGEYVESPFTLVPSTSLVSQGGAKVTFISAATPTGNFITVSGSSYMEGFTIYTPTDDSAA